MSSELILPLERAKIRGELEEKIKAKFKMSYGSFLYPIADVRFLNGNGTWHERLVRLRLDTCSSITLLTKGLCEELNLKEYVTHWVMGIVPEEICKLPVKIFKTQARIEDLKGNISKNFEAWIACSKRNDTPLILGIKEIFENFKLEVNPIKEELRLKEIS